VVANSQAATIDAIAGCCARIDEECSGLDEADWHRPTTLPAWDIQDVVAHLGSLEAMLLGRDEPHHVPGETAHVRNELGALNERLVDRRRSWSGAEVLDEFRTMSELRLEELRTLDEEELQRMVPSPAGGTVAQAAFLGIRLWDFFVHEMDICDALGRPTRVDTPAGRRVLDEMLLLFPRAVGKGGAPEGALVRLDLVGPLPRSVAATVTAGRGVAADPAAGEATLHLRASPTAFLRVATGRRPAAQAIGAGDVDVIGDSDLAARILSAVNVVP
jgi:uncharacterized protein (TIGR03083 family)